MKIRGRIIFTLVGFVMAFGASVLACGSSSSGTVAGLSGSGQSCTRTSDCTANLVCLANQCLSIAPVDASVAVGDSGEAGVTTSTGPHLGQIGEACQTSRDCATGFACVTTGNGSACDIVSYGLTATGKSCTGECSTAADCCELPTNIGDLYYLPDGGFSYQYIPVHSCADVLAAIGGDPTVCTAGDAGPANVELRNACFYYQAYCSPACATNNTWACTNNRCSYIAPCQPTGAQNSINGCPTATRASSISSATCNAVTNTCLSLSACTTSADCDGKSVSDTAGALCRSGDCSCYQSGCYLTCKKDLDCQAGYTCNTSGATAGLCSPTGCAANADCVTQLGNVRAQCKSGSCSVPCTDDHDCGSSGDLGTAFSQQVCSNGACQPLGCSSDSDCQSSGVHLFCVTPTPTTYHSAVTN
jgi:hypothetical protein